MILAFAALAAFGDSFRSAMATANALATATGEAGGELKKILSGIKEGDIDEGKDMEAALAKIYDALGKEAKDLPAGAAAACRDYLYEIASGIQKGYDGSWEDFELAPIPDKRLVFVEAEKTIAAGTIKSAWKYERGKCLWKFTIPPGAKATVCVNGVCQRYQSGEHQLELK